MYISSKPAPLPAIAWLVSALVHLGIYAAVSWYITSTQTLPATGAQQPATVVYTRVDLGQPPDKNTHNQTKHTPHKPDAAGIQPPSPSTPSSAPLNAPLTPHPRITPQNSINTPPQSNAAVTAASSLNAQVSAPNAASLSPAHIPTASVFADKASQTVATSSMTAQSKDPYPPSNIKAAVTTPLPKPKTLAKVDSAYADTNKRNYPQLSKKLREEGTVLLNVAVSITGRVKGVTLKKSSGYTRLDESALQDVQSWRFTPATLDGQAVESVVDVPVEYDPDD